MAKNKRSIRYAFFDDDATIKGGFIKGKYDYCCFDGTSVKNYEWHLKAMQIRQGFSILA